MAYSNFSERCSATNEVAEGLLAQLAYMKRNVRSMGASPQCLKVDDWSKLRTKLGNTFPQLPDTSKLQGFDSFRGKAESVVEELDGYYSTFLDIHEFRTSVTVFLKEIAAADLTISLSLSADLARNFIRLTTNYFKLLYYVSTVDEAKVVLSLYALAFTLQSGNQEPENWANVSQLVKEVTSPLEAVFRDLHEGATTDLIGDRLETLLPELYGTLRLALDAHLSASSSNRNPLDLLIDVKSMALPVLQYVEELPLAGPSTSGQAELSKPGLNSNSRLLHMEIANSADYFQYALYSFFICPQLIWRSQELYDIFKNLAADCLYLPVYRDQSFAVHTELEALIKWFSKSKKQQCLEPHRIFKKVNLSKSLVPEVLKDASENAGKLHRSRMSYVTQELQKLVSVLRHAPGVIAPKFPVVLATLSLAKTEILWFFRHRSNLPKKKSKLLNDEDFAVPHLPFTMYLFQEIADTVKDYGAIVQLYYIDYLKSTHGRALRENIQKLASFMKDYGSKVSQALNSFLPAITNPPKNGDSYSFEELRLNWTRIESLLSTTSSNQVASNDVSSAIARMRTLTTHSKFVDSLDILLVNFGQISDCFWHWDALQQIFRDSITAEGQNGRACMVFIKILGSAIYARSPLCPSEYTVLRNEVQQKAESLLQDVGDQLSQQLSQMLEYVEQLNRQLAPVRAVERTERKRSQKSSLKSKQQLPGAESFLRESGSSSPIAGVETNLSEILYAVNNVVSVSVFDYTFNPREYIRSKVENFLKRAVQEAFFNPSMQMNPPSSILRKLSSVYHSFERVAAYINIDIAHLVRKVLYDESYDAQCFTFKSGGMHKANKDWKSAGNMPLVFRIARWYFFLLDNEKFVGTAIFSEVHQNFVVVPGEKYDIDINLYLDKWEIRTLIQILGGHGVRVLDEMLCQHVADNARILLKTIESSASTLEKWETNLGSGSAAGPLSPLLIPPSELASFWLSSVKIGNALVCRRIITAATKDASYEYVPFLAGSMKMAHEDENTAVAFRAPDALHVAYNLSYACGVARRDFPLWNTLQNFAANQSCTRLLSVAFAGILISDVWKKVEYLAAFDGFKTNDHVAAYTIDALLSHMDTTDSLNQKEKFVSLSASVLLRMRVCGDMQNSKINAAYTFLERFARIAHISRGVLEAHLPYVVIHASRTDLHMNKPRSAAVDIAAAAAANSDTGRFQDADP